MKLHGLVSTALVLFSIVVMPLLGHHGIAHSYDESKATTIKGVITKVEWMNPHVEITLETKDANGLVTSWRVGIRAPNALSRDGIRREDFELAKSCSMEIWPARDGSKTATGRTLTFVNGKTFEVRDTFGEFPGTLVK